MDFAHTPRARGYLESVRHFLESEILPAEAAHRAHLSAARERPGPWTVPPVTAELKAAARAAGLWNLYLSDPAHGPGLTTAEYAPLAEQMGHSPLAPEVFNCNAPDTGNAEVLLHHGTREQRDRWLAPLLAGEIRSAFCMTEPGVASSDATTMAATAVVQGDEVVLNGRKWWSTGLGHPDCRFLVFMGLTDPAAERHRRHSMVLVPTGTPGVRIERMLPVLGHYDEPYGHGEVTFTDVRLPRDAVIGGPGHGFAIAQSRLGPGRIHHCMRLIGLAERALHLACRRATARTAFGRPLADLGGNRERIARARIAIDQARLHVLHAAWLLDTRGPAAARGPLSQVKAAVPAMACDVVDMAVQLHGAAGLSDDTPLAAAYATARALRLADGPDEVHLALVARLELAAQQEQQQEQEQL
ncbi:acyl-CoA dehydrogenase family protein [Streptomyces johnsoniae]|uniref:Acyl-CoA dehydrogenase family protein n=1 Tax=Streptomyces johnsoniae TaxID=3075532 RepID=A0ABU2SA18_9ACTN|nr:acyl-CoA dehydrogenase family protein [Streptomyces sp. DSM 41886]MDT0445817.1 acyl-CoA dehydrogenase family protein [Streptomyces sp. DSM 41886]